MIVKTEFCKGDKAVIPHYLNRFGHLACVPLKRVGHSIADISKSSVRYM